MGKSTTSSDGAWRGRAWASLVVGAAVLLLVHAVLQGVAAGGFWRPCFENGYSSDVCMYLQYEAPTPWWAYLSWLWPAEMILLITVLAVALRSRMRAWPVIAALALVAVCNVLTDYVITPAFNGGYTSADSAPGHGIFGAVGIALAGCVLLVGLVPRRRMGNRVDPVLETPERAEDTSPARPSHEESLVRD